MAWFIRFYKDGKPIHREMHLDHSYPSENRPLDLAEVENAKLKLASELKASHWLEVADDFETYEYDND